MIGLGSASNSACHRRGDVVVAAGGAEAIELGRVADVAALGPHGGEEPTAQLVGVVTGGGEGGGRGGGVRTHGGTAARGARRLR